MINPRISIITPSYNQAQYIEQTILSVINQNYPNLEYIIIDGGSDDNTLEIIKKYEKRVDYWISEPDTGQSNAINKGLKKAKGDIITWINSDDLLVPGALNSIVRYFPDHPDVMLVHGKTILFNDKNLNLPTCPVPKVGKLWRRQAKEIIKGAPEEDLKYRYLAYVPFPQPSSFFRREVIEKLGYLDETLHYGMDYDLFVRIALNYEILKVENIFSKYRLHRQSKSTAYHINFAYDWAKVFSKLLRSFDFTGELITNLQELQLYNNENDSYKVKKKKTKNDVYIAFLYFLEAQIHIYYENLDLKKAKQIASFVKNFDWEFYKSHKIDKIEWRTQFLAKPIIKFLRNFSR